MYIACYNGHDEVVNVFLDHGVNMDAPDKVSDISCIHIKVYKYRHVNVSNIIDVQSMEIT